ncbi:GNAT family N-acetyltransferase [Dyella sp. C9]|uniref:GNAT family N-acetyltransferase n=1 Tax=Dyella sp. C9 TaxID=2202154 RepID=UPI0018E4F28F|nr:GNAT family N-acetyltransferase [Dyella sp. C9]
MQVRAATPDDAERLAALVGELGYPTTGEAMRERLATMSHPASDAVLVAEEGGVVLGCISLHLSPMLHVEGRVGRITTLVVDEHQRGQGIGRVLLDAAHAWFARHGCRTVELTSGIRRERAHRFYESNGYTRRSVRFVRQIDAS